MITADTLKTLTSVKKGALVEALERNPIRPSWIYAIKKCRFLGLTNGNEFCYALEYDGRVALRSNMARRPEKVFISMNTKGLLVADI